MIKQLYCLFIFLLSLHFHHFYFLSEHSRVDGRWWQVPSNLQCMLFYTIDTKNSKRCSVYNKIGCTYSYFIQYNHSDCVQREIAILMTATVGAGLQGCSLRCIPLTVVLPWQYKLSLIQQTNGSYSTYISQYW